MQFIFKASTNRCYKNLLISDKVAVIILDEYSNASFHDIVFIEHYTPNKQPQYYRINLTHAVYMPLHYMLLFPYSDTS